MYFFLFPKHRVHCPALSTLVSDQTLTFYQLFLCLLSVETAKHMQLYLQLFCIFHLPQSQNKDHFTLCNFIFLCYTLCFPLEVIMFLMFQCISASAERLNRKSGGQGAYRWSKPQPERFGTRGLPMVLLLQPSIVGWQIFWCIHVTLGEEFQSRT